MPTPAHYARIPALVLGCGLLLALAAPTAAAQDGLRAMRAWEEPVKLADGTETTYRYEAVYDYATARTVRTAYDATGAVVEVMEMTKPLAPTPDELAAGRALVLADAEMARLVSVNDATVEGGFLLHERDGCAPLGRCLQFDLIPPGRRQSVRFVVVDLATAEITERDFHPGLGR